MIDTLLTRRSVKLKLLENPAPEGDKLEQILRAATRVPDHGKLAPWRIRIIKDKGLTEFAALVASRFAAIHPDANEKQIEHERERLLKAPLILAVLYTPQEGRIPLWEQELSVGAVCMNVLHAANALGFAGCWLTEWIAYDAELSSALGCGERDKVAGLIYLGTPSEKPEERPRPELADVVSEWRVVGA